MSPSIISIVNPINSFEETMTETEYFLLSSNEFSDDDNDEIKNEHMESPSHYTIICEEFVDDDICVKVKELEIAKSIIDVINLSFPYQPPYESPQPCLEPRPPDTKYNIQNYWVDNPSLQDISLLLGIDSILVTPSPATLIPIPTSPFQKPLGGTIIVNEFVDLLCDNSSCTYSIDQCLNYFKYWDDPIILKIVQALSPVTESYKLEPDPQPPDRHHFNGSSYFLGNDEYQDKFLVYGIIHCKISQSAIPHKLNKENLYPRGLDSELFLCIMITSTQLGNQACAACKYQRRKCIPDCPLAPYFPSHHQAQFLNAHRLFGVSNILKITRNLNQFEKDEAMRTMIIQADARAADPVGGCYRIVRDLQRQIDYHAAELDFVVKQIVVCRVAATQSQDPLQQLVPYDYVNQQCETLHLEQEEQQAREHGFVVYDDNYGEGFNQLSMQDEGSSLVLEDVKLQLPVDTFDDRQLEALNSENRFVCTIIFHVLL
ncbi:hypothetical protein GIB67_010615 [Kingdonia uniflora]|uniref:LOB domain-containing protein n=1 Tax=Kingdonia uniflora TaxID=39325 RepID=A0A7J7M814_9MAGN|nr:hypothetical protein GIB67_010615 [Kingdonia uniflora]